MIDGKSGITFGAYPRSGERAGLTVRTLHHYDQIGLVRASGADEGRPPALLRGRRPPVVPGRGAPLPRRALARIARALEGDGFTLKDTVTAQLEAVDAELLHARRPRRRLERILEVLERSDDPSVSELTQIMELMRMHETYYTPEQLARLEARREEVGEDQIAAIEREWTELSGKMEAHRDAARTRRIPRCARSRSAGAASPNARSPASPAATPASPRASAACTRRKARRKPPTAPSTPTCWST
jgi:DNA-binding transcriptional MerR regulator